MVSAPSGEPPEARPGGPPEAQAQRARARRNLVIALSLLAFIVLIYLVTIVRLQENVLQRPI